MSEEHRDVAGGLRRLLAGKRFRRVLVGVAVLILVMAAVLAVLAVRTNAADRAWRDHVVAVVEQELEIAYPSYIVKSIGSPGVSATWPTSGDCATTTGG